MFENLKLFELKGLKECELSGLGQINVICGKNNSGKSTVLEAINSPANRAHGKTFSATILDKLHKGTITSFPFRNNNLYINAYRELLKIVLQNKKVWYENEFDAFKNQLKIAFEKNRDLRQQWNTTSLGNLSNEFTQLLTISLDSLLIPPKRQLELSKQIQAKDSAKPNGTGILNLLFFCRNQPESTEGKRLYNKIQQHFTEISSGYSFDIYMNDSNMAILNFSRGKDEWITASDCGLGLQDLLVLLWFAIDPNRQVILIEEPESHIHPEMQRKLLEFFRSQTNKQFFLSTHSNVFVNSAYVDKIFLTQFDESIKIADATSRASVLNDLGYSITDNLVSDLVILVEGPKDVPVIEEFLIKKVTTQ